MSSNTMSSNTMSPNTMSPKNNTKSTRKSGHCEVCCFCFMLLFFLGLIVGSIAAFVIWIVALVNGKNLVITEKCPDNQLWEWLLVWGLVTFVLVGGNTKKNKDEENNDCLSSGCKICCNMIIVICSIVLCWWGNEQLENDNNCIERNYNNTVFYDTAIVFWWFHFIALCITVGILGVFILGLVMYLVLVNCKCGRNLMDQIYSKNSKNHSEDDLIEDIIPVHVKNEGKGDLLEV